MYATFSYWIIPKPPTPATRRQIDHTQRETIGFMRNPPLPPADVQVVTLD